MAKERLDAYMARTGLAESREKAQKLIMAGLVLVGGEGEKTHGMSGFRGHGDTVVIAFRPDAGIIVHKKSP